MNVLLTGASGFIGSHVARALRAAEYVVIETRRSVDDGTASVRADFTRDLSVRHWLPKLAGIDAVINAVGIIREHGAQTFESLRGRHLMDQVKVDIEEVGALAGRGDDMAVPDLVEQGARLRHR